MSSFLATCSAALMNVLVLLGMAFILSRFFRLLRACTPLQRQLFLGLGFSAIAIGSMMVSFPMAPGIIGDLRNVVVAVAAIVGGPVPALITTVAASLYRLQLGGHFVAAIFGIVLAATLSIAFARSAIAKTPWNLALFGIGLAVANASLPLLTLYFSPVSTRQALAIGSTVLFFASILYPIAIVVVGGLLRREQQRAEDEAQLRAANDALSLESARTLGVFETSDVAMVWGDLVTGRIVRASPAYARFVGYSEAELAGKRLDDLLLDGERDDALARLADLASGKIVSTTSECRYVRKDGRIVWGLRSVTAVREGGVPQHAFVIIQDITERKKAREEVTYLATHDTLTGLANRLLFQTKLAELLATREEGEEIAVVTVDLDEFQDMNDTLGHAAGDTILREVANRLRSAATAGDVIARVGGDGFATLRRHAGSREEIERFAADLIGQLKAPFSVGGSPATMAMSMGIALASRDGRDADELLKKADIALSCAKQENNGWYNFFEPEMEARLRARQVLKIDLAAALSNRELELMYQPVIDLRSGKVSSFEALLRWRHPNRGLILPSEFIPLAEETGLIVPIGEWVLDVACHEAMAWPAHIGLAVNISSAQFRSPAMPLRVADALARSGLPPSRLELEITETVLLHDSDSNLRMLNDLRELGVSIALDDFGTGYSSLGYIQRFPFDRIKIDRSFVQGVTEREEAKAVIRALVGLGHSLNMRITAEGVETKAQLDRLVIKGCDEVQGFIFSPPVAAAEVLPLIARIESGPLRHPLPGLRLATHRRA